MRTTIARCGNIKNIYFIVLCVILLQMVGCTQASIRDENLPSENIVITNNDVVMPENLNKSDNIFEQIEGSWEIVDFVGTINNFHSEIEETSEYNEQIEKLISEKSKNTIGKIIQITDETVYGYYPLSEMGYFVDNESSLMCVTHFLPNGDETVFPYLTLRVKLIDGEEYIFLIDSNNEAFCGIDNYYWEVKKISADITNSSGNNTIDNQMKEFISLNNTEKIAYQSFVTDCCYRVSITSDSTYFNDRFTRDYFFFDDEKIHPLIVEYPSDNDTDTDRKVYNNCTFSAKFEDITFDGNDDLLISLGYVGIPEWECFCAYIYKDGQYEYNKSFEQIVDYKIDSVGNLLIGSKLENAMHDNPFYYYYVNDKHTIIYENDRFVLSEIPYEADPSAASDYIRKVLQNETSLIDETGNLGTWEEYEYESVSFWNESDSYAYIDFDCDGEKELIVNAMGYSAILDYQEQNVYCYTFPSRAINRIRTDGVFHDGGAGAGVNAFYKIKFYHGLYIKYCVQCFDNSNSGYFFINNTEVTKEEFDKISYDYLNDNSYYEFNPYDIEMIISEL